MNETHDDMCTCEFCKLQSEGFSEMEILGKFLKAEAKILKEKGFICHYVSEKLKDGIFFQYHTHGLEVTKKHMDFQIVLPISQITAVGIFENIVKLIDKGQIFKDMDIITEGIIQQGYPIKLMEVTQGDRKVLRVLICDGKGILPGDSGCDISYDIQNSLVTN